MELNHFITHSCNCLSDNENQSQQLSHNNIFGQNFKELVSSNKNNKLHIPIQCNKYKRNYVYLLRDFRKDISLEPVKGEITELKKENVDIVALKSKLEFVAWILVFLDEYWITEENKRKNHQLMVWYSDNEQFYKTRISLLSVGDYFENAITNQLKVHIIAFYDDEIIYEDIIKEQLLIKGGEDLNDHSKLFRAIQDVEKENGGPSKAHIIMGDISYIYGVYDLAIAHYLKSIELDPTNSQTYHKIGCIYIYTINIILNQQKNILKKLQTLIITKCNCLTIKVTLQKVVSLVIMIIIKF